MSWLLRDEDGAAFRFIRRRRKMEHDPLQGDPTDGDSVTGSLFTEASDGHFTALKHVVEVPAFMDR